MPTPRQEAERIRTRDDLPSGERSLSVLARALVDKNANVILDMQAIQNGDADALSMAQSLLGIAGQSVLPAGSVTAFAGSTAPAGWLLCYGQSLLRTAYPVLFTAIGTSYGAADGTHFSLPDMRGRVAIGKDNMGGSTAGRLPSVAGTTLGATGGEDQHVLSQAELPSAITIPTTSIAVGSFGGTNLVSSVANLDGQATFVNDPGGNAHNNLQPFIILNYIIKT